MKLLNINKSLLIIVIGSLTISISSCKKFLNEKSDKILVELKSLSDLQAMLDNDIYMNRGISGGFGEASSDDYFLTKERLSSLSDLNNKIYTWNVDEYNYPNDWNVGYYGIYVANYVLDHLNDIPITSDNNIQYRNVKGTAHFFKAFIYLSLVFDYGKAYDENTSDTDLGITLRNSSDPSIKSVRSSVKECYGEIISHAKKASDLLNIEQIIPLRPGKPAALGLLARAYLSMRNYDSAFKYSDLCLDLKSDIVDFNDPALNLQGRPLFRQFNKEILFYSAQSVSHTIKSPSVASIDTLLFESYGNNDLRKKAFFFARSGYQSFKGSYSPTSYIQLFSGIAVDEVLLIRAESSLRKNEPDLGQALEDLNFLLTRRIDNTFVPYQDLTISTALEIVLQERRKELLMRGLRWSDIKRLNLEGRQINLVRKTPSGDFHLQANDKRFALPLPFDIISITGMQQN